MGLKIPGEPTFRIGALAIVAAGFIASAILRAGEVVAALPEGNDDGFGNPIAKQQQPVENTNEANSERTVVGPGRGRERAACRPAGTHCRDQTAS